MKLPAFWYTSACAAAAWALLAAVCAMLNWLCAVVVEGRPRLPSVVRALLATVNPAPSEVSTAPPEVRNPSSAVACEVTLLRAVWTRAALLDTAVNAVFMVECVVDATGSAKDPLAANVALAAVPVAWAAEATAATAFALPVASAVLTVKAEAVENADCAAPTTGDAELIAVGSCWVASDGLLVSSVLSAVAAAFAAIAAISACDANAPCEIGTEEPEELVTVLWVTLTFSPEELVRMIGVVVVVVLFVVDVPPVVVVGVTLTIGVVVGGAITDDCVAVLDAEAICCGLSTVVVIRKGSDCCWAGAAACPCCCPCCACCCPCCACCCPP